MLYKQYCTEAGVEKPAPRHKVRDELGNYFKKFHPKKTVNGEVLHSYYEGFRINKLNEYFRKEEPSGSLVLDKTTSLLDELLADMPAQLATDEGTPRQRWADVTTTLKDIDTTQLHYVKVPENHIVIDFDLKGEDGTRDLERNLREAASWPVTYAELSKSGEGVHLHYVWAGETPVSELHQSHSEGVEVKVFRGGSSLRRRLSIASSNQVASLSSGLRHKEERVINATAMQSEHGIRALIQRNIRKEIHPGTKPSIDFIQKILDDAYSSGMEYDVSDLRQQIIRFANNSTNQALACIKAVNKMKFRSEEKPPEGIPEKQTDSRMVFFDIEVYPNLFVVCWKYEDDPTVVRMINPKANDVEALFQLQLVGFNNRRYDNHILYAAAMGYNNQQLYQLSQKIIAGSPGAMFGGAYSLSFADIYDFSSLKQSLKKFEISLGLRHLEMDIPWDEPVKDEDIPRVVEYCANDVIATEAVYKARAADFKARQLLAELSGLTVNDPTPKHTARIIFGDDRYPQAQFVYTDLSKQFEGYTYDRGVSIYRHMDVGEGGYVYSEPGIYRNVALLDVASMHPTSAISLNLFGLAYTNRFAELIDARLAIKHRDHDKLGKVLGGRLRKFVDNSNGNSEALDELAYALKIVVNTVYGLTSAKFDNPFRDVRNKDNIVAKRGALFMVDLQYAVQEQGFTVAHIKTDSIKIPNATPEIIRFVMDFGKQYGYTFEHEATYDRMALVNDAVYIAKKGDHWTATGAQFAHPFVFKTLFSGEPVTQEDFFETKQVSKGHIYIDPLPDSDPPNENLVFVGRTGQFVPVAGGAGGVLYRIDGEKRHAVTGTKNWRWAEAEVFRANPDIYEIDMNYFEALTDAAVTTIGRFGDFDEFVKG